MIKKVMSGVLALSVLALSGCGSKEEVTTCKVSQMGVEQEAKLTHKGDNVSIQELTVIMDATGMSEEDQQAALDQDKNQYKDVEGVSVKSEIKDGKYTGTLTVDYTKADMEELTTLGLVESQDGKADFVSYKATVKSMEDQGLTCDE